MCLKQFVVASGLLVCAGLARADIVVTEQAASLIASGDDGTLQAYGPEHDPWNHTTSSGGGSDGCIGLAMVTTAWTASVVSIDTTVSMYPCQQPVALTEAFAQIDVIFDLTAPANVEVRFDVDDYLFLPPPPFVFTTTRLVNYATSEELVTSTGVHVLALPAGPYRFQVQNMIGNGPNASEFGPGGRGIVGTLRILSPTCDIDFNNDTLFPDTQDIDDFLSVFAGVQCPTPTPPGCDSIDFNGDGIFPDTADIDGFLQAFAGPGC